MLLIIDFEKDLLHQQMNPIEIICPWVHLSDGKKIIKYSKPFAY
jgi:hypothetical protein